LTAKTRIFICYAREDELSARRLFNDLKKAGLDPWLDKESLLPGQEWRQLLNIVTKDEAVSLISKIAH